MGTPGTPEQSEISIIKEIFFHIFFFVSNANWTYGQNIEIVTPPFFKAKAVSRAVLASVQFWRLSNIMTFGIKIQLPESRLIVLDCVDLNRL